MRLVHLITFVLGLLIGAVALWWFAIGGISPPADQEISRIDVTVSQLKSDDRWLEKMHFQVIPLKGVKSFSGYALLLITPPQEGVLQSPSRTSLVDLVASTTDVMQPISIQPRDFGPNGNQPALKFIDEEFRFDRSGYYNASQQLSIRSDSAR